MVVGIVVADFSLGKLPEQRCHLILSNVFERGHLLLVAVGEERQVVRLFQLDVGRQQLVLGVLDKPLAELGQVVISIGSGGVALAVGGLETKGALFGVCLHAQGIAGLQKYLGIGTTGTELHQQRAVEGNAQLKIAVAVGQHPDGVFPLVERGAAPAHNHRIGFVPRQVAIEGGFLLGQGAVGKQQEKGSECEAVT